MCVSRTKERRLPPPAGRRTNRWRYGSRRGPCRCEPRRVAPVSGRRRVGGIAEIDQLKLPVIIGQIGESTRHVQAHGAQRDFTGRGGLRRITDIEDAQPTGARLVQGGPSRVQPVALEVPVPDRATDAHSGVLDHGCRTSDVQAPEIGAPPRRQTARPGRGSTPLYPTTSHRRPAAAPDGGRPPPPTARRREQAERRRLETDPDSGEGDRIRAEVASLFAAPAARRRAWAKARSSVGVTQPGN